MESGGRTDTGAHAHTPLTLTGSLADAPLICLPSPPSKGQCAVCLLWTTPALRSNLTRPLNTFALLFPLPAPQKAPGEPEDVSHQTSLPYPCKKRICSDSNSQGQPAYSDPRRDTKPSLPLTSQLCTQNSSPASTGILMGFVFVFPFLHRVMEMFIRNTKLR